jgi:hypothetical protein
VGFQDIVVLFWKLSGPIAIGGAIGVNTHWPVPGSQASVVQAMPSSHTTPAHGSSGSQLSVPSLHDWVAGSHGGLPGVQMSFTSSQDSEPLQNCPSWQLRGKKEVQTPPEHLSLIRQKFPSSQEFALFV